MYPKLAAQHLIDGLPIELVDGDSNMVNIAEIKCPGSGSAGTAWTIQMGNRFQTPMGQVQIDKSVETLLSLISIKNKFISAYNT